MTFDSRASPILESFFRDMWRQSSGTDVPPQRACKLYINQVRGVPCNADDPVETSFAQWCPDEDFEHQGRVENDHALTTCGRVPRG